MTFTWSTAHKAVANIFYIFCQVFFQIGVTQTFMPQKHMSLWYCLVRVLVFQKLYSLGVQKGV